MVSRQQWLGVRLRHSWHRLCLRCFRSDSQKKSQSGMIVTRDRNTTRRRRRRRFFDIIIKCSLVVITTTAGLSLLRSRQEQDVSSEDFRNSVNAMYEQGTAAGAGDGATVSGSEPTGKDTLSTKRYDPKARAFVDPSVQPRWGPEADKGREKRRLFMEIHEMSKGKGRPQLTLQQLMALPSTFDPSRALSDTTIILNHWKRTTLADQLDAILNLTVAPVGGVWVCLFDSPREEEYRAVVEEYRERFTGLGGLFLVASSFNFKYYGRFQLALQARTRYVWIVDDDVMPGRKFLEQLSHIAGIPEANGGKGGVDGDGSIGPMALGSVGWIMPGVKPYNGMFYGYRYRTDRGGLYLPDKRYGIPVPHLQEVDLLCSHWFVERDWIPLLFREHWETAETGEDYMLAYSLRKYAGVRSYVVPMDLTDSETWGNTDVDWDMQNQGGGATTLHNMVPTRDRLWHRLFKRGGDYFLSPRYAQSPRPILIVVDSERDAALLRPLFLQLEALSRSSAAPADSRPDAGKGEHGFPAAVTHSRPPRVVLTLRGGTAASCALAAAVFSGVSYQGRVSDTPLCNPQHFASAWQLNAGRHYPRDRTERAGGAGGRDHTLMLDLATGILGAVETVRPLAVVSVGASGVAAGRGGRGGGGSAIDEALSAVSTQSGVPLIRLPRMDRSSGAVRWLAWLSPEAFGRWQDVRLDILVLYDPSPPPADDGQNGENNGNGGAGHTEKQLAALLTSLSKTNYLGDDVRLTVAVSAGSRVPDSVSKLEWQHGPKRVREALYVAGDTNGSAAGGRRISTADVAGGGELSSNALAPLALRSWVPPDSNNYVLVLEANSVVSEFFYSWLKVAVLETNYADDPPLEAEGGGDGRGGEGEDASGGSAGAYSVCLPNTAGGAGAWLLAPGPWRSSQARCFGNGKGVSGGRAGDGEKRCGRDALIPPSERSLCPSNSGALVTDIDAEGSPLSEAGSLIGDDRALVVLAKRALFEGR